MRLYDKVKAQVLRSKPPNAGAVPRMYTFVMHFAGGRSGEFLRETEAFLRIKCVPARHLAAEVYESLATEMRHTGAQQFPKCRHALLKALFTTESRITASDLRRLFSQKSGMMPQLEECEGLITDVQKLFKDLDVPAEVKLQHQGDFEISLMFRLLQKKEPGKEQHDSLQSVAHSAVMLMREHSGLKTPDLVSPWRPSSSGTTTSGGSASAAASHSLPAAPRNLAYTCTCVCVCVLLVWQGHIICEYDSPIGSAMIGTPHVRPRFVVGL